MTEVTLGSWPDHWDEPGGLPAGLHRALSDGIERTFAGALPPWPSAAVRQTILAGGEPVGVLAWWLHWPRRSAATIVALAIDPAARGHAYAARALLLAEATLDAAGVEHWYAVVPRTNGRGLYALLRCGYAPLAGRPVAGVEADAGIAVTWFRRALPTAV